jgi:hypothetical protein
MGTRLHYYEWKPVVGDVIVGHILYFENPEDGTTSSIIRSHGAFYRIPPEVRFQINAMKPADGALVVVEYQPEGYRVAVLCEYRQAAKKRKRLDQALAHKE